MLKRLTCWNRDDALVGCHEGRPPPAACALHSEPDFGLHLDAGPSISLLKGFRALARQVLGALAHLGLTVNLRAAPRTAGAWLLARRCSATAGRRSGQVLKHHNLATIRREGLQDLPTAPPP